MPWAWIMLVLIIVGNQVAATEKLNKWIRMSFNQNVNVKDE